MKISVTLDEYGDPGRIRTCDLRIRSPLLYPAELRGQIPNGPKLFDPPEAEIVGIVLRPHAPRFRLAHLVGQAEPLGIGDRLLLAVEA